MPSGWHSPYNIVSKGTKSSVDTHDALNFIAHPGGSVNKERPYNSYDRKRLSSSGPIRTESLFIVFDKSFPLGRRPESNWGCVNRELSWTQALIGVSDSAKRFANLIYDRLIHHERPGDPI